MHWFRYAGETACSIAAQPTATERTRATSQRLRLRLWWYLVKKAGSACPAVAKEKSEALIIICEQVIRKRNDFPVLMNFITHHYSNTRMLQNVLHSCKQTNWKIAQATQHFVFRQQFSAYLDIGWQIINSCLDLSFFYFGGGGCQERTTAESLTKQKYQNWNEIICANRLPFFLQKSRYHRHCRV